MKYSLPVEGMTCASCVARVEKALSKIEGIENVSVNFANEKVTFDIDDSVSLETAQSAVEKYGYKLHTDTVNTVSEENNESIADKHYEKIKKDLILGLVFILPVFIISMIREFDWFTSVWKLNEDYTNKILLILTTPVIFISGKRYYSSFWTNIKHFSFEMNSLVAISTAAAYGYSVVATLFPDWISLDANKLPHVYFETAGVIIVLITFGKMLEARAKRKTGDAIKKLLELKPKDAIVLVDGKEKIVPLEKLKIGDRVIIKPGGKIPADGKVIKGRSVVDESMLTGESAPVEKNTGSEVIGGTINKNGSFVFEVQRIGDNSVLGQIIKLVEEAQSSKAPIQQLADKVSSVFVPAVIAIAVIAFLGWLLFATENNFNLALINFVAVLIIACPCALGLATPTAIIVGTGLGAQHGIIIKNGESLEKAHKINTIVLDKTGTITVGNPEVTDIITDGISKEQLIAYSASIESKSEHPIGLAVVDYAKKNNIPITEVESFQVYEGMGVSSIIDSNMILLGNEELMRNYSININSLQQKSIVLSKEGKSIIFVAINGELKGLIAIADPVKGTSQNAVKRMKEKGIEVIMLTGDNINTAKAIAGEVGIDKYFAGVLPDKKAGVINELKKSGKIVAMVGDGINDSPALASADLGIAIGTGTDIAIESSDITLVKGDLNSVVDAIELSTKVIKTIKQNLFWAFVYNIIGIPFAALGFLNPMIGAFAMSLSSVSVISNSLRLKRTKI